MGTREIPPLLLADGSFAVEAVDKANALADQFDSVWNPLAPNSTLELPTDCPVDFEFLADVDDIRDLLKELNPKKSPGPDLLPSLPLLKNSDILAPSLTLLINRAIKETRFPSEWKQAFVSPIPKVVGSAECADYRPIILLPIVSKICEKFLKTQLQKFTDPLLSSRQFGFRRGRSTLDALASLELHICRGFELCKSKISGSTATQVSGVFFDVKKAFDQVPHHQLLQCLKDRFELPDFLLSLLWDCLSGRKQMVRVGGKLSSPRQVKSGVPQGSVLGPVLFIAYVNSVAELEMSTNAELIFYADDLVYTKPLLSTD
ncbi:MAG: reverse transcriptase family protein, partial [Gammaproteobacteria bacterium]|nr:reverse transcriptase family protein [Gammaproteobacteria bacterium]